MEKSQASCLAVNLPPKILIAICSFNAPPCSWDKFTYQVDGSVEDDDNAENDDPVDGDSEDDEDESAPPVSTNHIRDTINASHVCRNWRTILLSAPELWCRMIDPYNPSMSKTMLERSQSLGISFSLPSHKEKDGRDEEDFEKEMTRQYVDRLKEYRFKCRFVLDLGPQSHYLRGSMNARYFPVLEDLSISFPTYSELPHKFPGAGTPNLKRLHLQQCFFQDGSRFSAVNQTLVRLHIDNSSLTEDSLVNALRALPRLQALILNRAFDRVAQAPAELRSDDFLCLSHLQELRITDVHSSRAASFLGRITTTQTLSIFCLELFNPNIWWENPPEPAFNARLFHQLSWILLGMTALKSLSSLEIAYGTGVTFCEDANAMLGDVSSGETHLIPTPERCFHVQFTPTKPFTYHNFISNTTLLLEDSKKTVTGEFLSAIGNLGAYVQVRHLVIPDYWEDINENVTTQILRQCRGVTVLEDVTLCLWELLCEMDDHDISEGSENFVLPSLEELSFDSLDVTFERKSDCRFDDETEADQSNEEITGALWLGRPISPDDSKSYVEKDDPDYHYESGNSDWEDEPSTFVEDLAEFCKRRASIRIIRFFEVENDILAECKRRLGPMGVDIIYED